MSRFIDQTIDLAGLNPKFLDKTRRCKCRDIQWKWRQHDVYIVRVSSRARAVIDKSECDEFLINSAYRHIQLQRDVDHYLYGSSRMKNKQTKEFHLFTKIT
eukprot:519737_1